MATKITYADKVTGDSVSASDMNSIKVAANGAIDDAATAINSAGTAQSSATAAQQDIDTHEARVDNPHAVTKAQVGLSNVNNTADANKPISDATQTALDAKVPTSRTVNAKPLSGNITLNQDDIAAGTTYTQYSKTEQTNLAGVVTDFVSLPFASTINWDMQNQKSPLAKSTITASFSLVISNFRSGGKAEYKITVNTGSQVTIALTGTGLTFSMANTSLTSYALPIGTGKTYFIKLTNDGGLVNVVIEDYSVPLNAINFTKASRTTALSTATGVYVPIPLETPDYNPINNWSAANPTRFLIPGTGRKLITITVYAKHLANATASTRRVGASVNGVQIPEIDSIPAVVSGGADSFKTSTFQAIINTTGTDYVEGLAFQNTGASLNLLAASVSVKIEDLA